MTNVVAFPKRGRQSIGVRIVPSISETGATEVQQFDAGAWRCRGLFFDADEAVRFNRRLVESVMLERITVADEHGVEVLIWQEHETVNLTIFDHGHERTTETYGWIEEAMLRAQAIARHEGAKIEVRVPGGAA